MESTLQKQETAADRVVKLLCVLCPLIYFASYLTRKNYGVIMAAIIANEGMADDVAGLIETLALISYGAGQVISGILGDKFKPQRIIICGLSTTIACNLLMPVCPNNLMREIVWFVNGFAQSMLWPPLVRIMAETMDPKTYSRVCANVNVAGIGGTIFLYLSYPLIWQKLFDTSGWRATFFSSAIICGVILAIWVFGFRSIRQDPRVQFKGRKAKAETGGITLINKRNIATSILLSIVTFGIYFIYWEYLLVKNTRAIKKDDSSCTGEMLCLIFVPFYSLYWWFTRGKILKDDFANHGYSATGNEIAYLVLGIFGLSIVSMAIMQNDFNSLPSESTKSNQQSACAKELNMKILLGSGFVLIALGIILQGMLRDGITDWDPKMISDTFGITADKAILKAVILPVIGVVSLKLVGYINEKYVKNEVRGAGIAFIAALTCLTALYFFHDKNEYLTLALSAVSVGLMHAINFFLICIVPLKFEKYGVVSTMSGIINSLTYVGSAAALYGFGFISETTNNNWRIVIGVWVVIAALGVAMCFLAIRPWKKFASEEAA